MTARLTISKPSDITGLQESLDAASPPTNSAVIFGSSIEAEAGAGTHALDVEPTYAVGGGGWWTWANGYLGQRLDLLHNAGVGGNTYAQMRARIQTDVIAYNPGWVFIGGPVNDVAQGRTFVDIRADLLAMLDTIGPYRRVVLMNAVPSVNYNTDPMRAVLHAWNNYVRELPTTRRNLIAVDAWRLVADPATGSPATGMSEDGAHLSPAGAQRVGTAVATAVSPLVAARPPRSSGITDPDNILSNPAFTDGTGWDVAGPAGVSLSWEVLTDRYGSQAVITMAGVTEAYEERFGCVEPVASGRYAGGDVVQMEARFQWADIVPLGGVGVPCAPWARLWPRLADDSFHYTALLPIGYGGSTQSVTGFPADGEMVLRTARMTLPPTVASLYIQFGWYAAASGVVRISDIAAWKNAV